MDTEFGARDSAEIINKLNKEPWYQSRVTWGSLVTIAASLAGVAGLTLDEGQRDLIVQGGVLVGTAAGGLTALYGRWIARRPIGA